MVLVAILAGVAYTAISSLTLYQQLDRGRRELAGGQAVLASTGQADSRSLPSVSGQLRQATQDFEAAHRHAQQDPALALLSGIAPADRQVQATAHLAAIGADISRAAQSAATIAVQGDQLRQQYAGKALTPEDLPGILKQTEAIVTSYGASAKAISDQLRAAHTERAGVDTTGLLRPLLDAYDQVDAALAAADKAFLRYQDVRRLLSDLLGLSPP